MSGHFGPFGLPGFPHVRELAADANLQDTVTKAGQYIYRAGGTDVPVTDGGTGASTAAGARTNLGIIAAPEAIAAASIAGATATVDIALSTYDLVEIDLISLEPSNDAAILYGRFSQDSGATFLAGAADYGWSIVTNGAAASDDSDSELQISDTVGNAAGERATVTVRIFRPSAATFAKAMIWSGFRINETGNFREVSGGGQLLANTDAISHVRFLWSAGTFDAGYYAARGYRFS